MISLIIPSYKRGKDHLIQGRDYFPTAKYLVGEFERDDYTKILGADRVISTPDEETNTIAKARNWVLQNIPRPLLMLDDDVYCVCRFEDKINQKKIPHTPKEAANFIKEGFRMAEEWGVPLWGINQTADPLAYREFCPFSLSNVVLGPFCGHLEHDCLYDETLPFKEDYDMSLQLLNKYRKILRLNKYHYLCDHGKMEGGCVSKRSLEVEKDNAERFTRKWGSKIVKFNYKNPKKITDVLNGRVDPPIRGV
jgi:hypothetical protein